MRTSTDATTRQCGNNVPGLTLELIAHRTGRGCQDEPKGDTVPFDLQIPDHTERYDIPLQIGILNLFEGG